MKKWPSASCANSLFSELFCPSCALRKDRLRWPVCDWLLFFRSCHFSVFPASFCALRREHLSQRAWGSGEPCLPPYLSCRFNNSPAVRFAGMVARVVWPQHKPPVGSALLEAHERIRETTGCSVAKVG